MTGRGIHRSFGGRGFIAGVQVFEGLKEGQFDLIGATKEETLGLNQAGELGSGMTDRVEITQ